MLVTVHVAPPARRPLPGAGVASWLTGFDAPAAALLSAAAARTPSTPRFHRRPSASERPISVPHQLTPDGPSSSGRPATRVALALRASGGRTAEGMAKALFLGLSACHQRCPCLAKYLSRGLFLLGSTSVVSCARVARGAPPEWAESPGAHQGCRYECAQPPTPRVIIGVVVVVWVQCRVGTRGA